MKKDASCKGIMKVVADKSAQLGRCETDLVIAHSVQSERVEILPETI